MASIEECAKKIVDEVLTPDVLKQLANGKEVDTIDTPLPEQRRHNSIIHELKQLRHTLEDQIEHQKNTTRVLLKTNKLLEGIKDDVRDIDRTVTDIESNQRKH